MKRKKMVNRNAFPKTKKAMRRLLKRAIKRRNRANLSSYGRRIDIMVLDDVAPVVHHLSAWSGNP